MTRQSFVLAIFMSGLSLLVSVPWVTPQEKKVPPAEDRDAAARRDLDRFQGNWSLVSAQRDGTPMAPEEVRKLRLAIQGNEFTLSKDAAVVSRGTFKLDPTRQPKQVDETITAGPNQGKVFSAIYEIDEDRHTVCFAAAGKERPTAFASAPGSGQLLQVWKRERK